jgi:hypothetical protein
MEVTRRVAAGEELIDLPVRQLWDATGSLAGRDLEAVVKELSRRGTEVGEQISRRLPGTGALAPLSSGEEGFLKIPLIGKRKATPLPDLFAIGTSKGQPVAGRVITRTGRRFAIELPDGTRVIARRGALGVAPDAAAAEQFLKRAAAGEDIEVLMREFQTAPSKLVNAVRAAARLEAELAPEYQAFRKAVSGKMGGVLRSGAYPGAGGTEKYIVATGAMRGGPGKAMAPLSQFLSENELTDLTSMIDRHFSAFTARNYDWRNTGMALTDMFVGGRKPMPFERRLLSEVFGDELGEVLSSRMLGQRAMAEFWEVLNVPRVVLASFDLSAPLRQGIMLLPGHPKESFVAFGKMLKAFVSEDAAKAVDDAIKATATYDLKQEAKLFLAPLAGELEEREELYMSRLLQRIPVLGAGVKASERAYITYLNKLRSDVFDTVHANWVGQGKTLEDYTALADFINKASGRGTIPKGTARYLSAGFFAPRFALSRPQAFLTLLSKSPSARAMAFRDMGLFVGTGVGVLSMLKAAAEVNGWDMDVEVDPRSTDFGKIRIGNTRLDFWGGAQQWVRYAAQLMPQLAWGDGFPSVKWEGARKAGTGFVYDVNRLATLSRFVRSKLSPQAGFLIDWMGGETFIGDEMMLSPGNIKLQVFNRFVPMAWQDMIDSIRMNGWKGAWVGLPSGLGLGTLTYKTTFDQVLEVRHEVMQDMGVTQAQVDLDPGLAARIDQDQRVKDIQAKLDADLIRHGATGPSAFYAHSRTIRREQETEQLLDDERLEQGLIDKGDWRYRTIERSGTVYNAIEGMRRVAGVEPGDRDIPEGPIHAAVNAYFAVDVKDYTNEAGWTDWYSFHNAQSDALVTLNPEQRGSALQAIHKYATPRAMLLHEDIDWVAQAGMFGAEEWVWKQVAPKMAPLPVVMDLQRKNLVDANPEIDVTDDDVRTWMAANMPEYAEYLRQVPSVQYNWRWDNPEGEARAYRAGLLDKILNPQAALIYYAWTGKKPDDFKDPPTEYRGRAYRRDMLGGE